MRWVVPAACGPDGRTQRRVGARTRAATSPWREEPLKRRRNTAASCVGHPHLALVVLVHQRDVVGADQISGMRVKQRVVIGVGVLTIRVHRCSPPSGTSRPGPAPVPGHKESAGRRRSGRTRAEPRWLTDQLNECARAAVRTKDNHLAAHYAPLRGRRGEQIAIAGDPPRAARRVLPHRPRPRPLPRPRTRLATQAILGRGAPRPTLAAPARSARPRRHARASRPTRNRTSRLTNSTTAPVSPPTPRQAIIYGQNVLASRGFTGQPPWKGEASRAVGGRASRSCRRLLVGSDPSAELTISDIRCAWDNPRTASARATILRSATGWLRCSDLANSRVALVDVGVRPPGSSLLADAATPVTPLLPM